MTKKNSRKNNKNNRDKNNDRNFFNEMAYEFAGDLGAVDNEEMKDNKKLISMKKKREDNLPK